MTKTPLAVVLLAAAACVCPAQRIEVTVPSTKPLNGHLILVIAKSEKPEPRMQLQKPTTLQKASASTPRM